MNIVLERSLIGSLSGAILAKEAPEVNCFANGLTTGELSDWSGRGALYERQTIEVLSTPANPAGTSGQQSLRASSTPPASGRQIEQLMRMAGDGAQQLYATKSSRVLAVALVTSLGTDSALGVAVCFAADEETKWH